ncbi:hypothetical protein Q73A0000_05065 [Kaistella flava (ex Peng et al. 2021)]|uniref:Uncharacterized protein n=1 Tax=Kaistella flava (ex Peng et al. 2021) TaxID=2038776 RepID=A0A7M2Y6R8_9FLAO|nr:hypothetical protein [Kaistella flava (ex Peng et al. 2021)]QOW09780.1 hypothetical protein Q73A0000_05065 [Kaistella flava (ex Peng et al. 2021)]
MLLSVDIEYFSKKITSKRHLFECQKCKQTLGIKKFLIHLADVHNEDVSNKYWSAYLLRCTKVNAIFELTEEFRGGEAEINHAVENYIKPKEREFSAFQLKENEKREKLLSIERQNLKREKEEKIRAAIVEEEKRAKQILDLKISESKTVYMVWEDVVFGKNKISFKHKTEFILPIDMQGIVEEMNLLKEGYFKKYYNTLLKFLVHKSIVLKEQSPGWDKIQDTVVLVEERVRSELNFNRSGSNKNLVQLPSVENLTNEEIIEKYIGNRSKSYYIQLLASMHSATRKIVPIIEQRDTVKEVSFLFTIKSKSRFYIVWENCNDLRGTHIFRAGNEEIDKVLRNLTTYIQDPEILQKRIVFWNKDVNSLQLKQKLQHYQSLKHNNRDAFVQGIKKLLK